PGRARPAAARGADAVEPLVPLRPRDHLGGRRPHARAAAAPCAALCAGGGARALAAVSRRPLPVGHPGRGGAGCRGRRALAMRIGIVGMPNAGKSSLFNALTRGGAEAANYPFTTVEPNVAIVPVPDERLDRVAETLGASPVVHEAIFRSEEHTSELQSR